jgi:hypothetical protein
VHGGSHSNLEANQTLGVLLHLSVGNAGRLLSVEGCCAGWVLDSKCISS